MALAILDNTTTIRYVPEVEDLNPAKFACIGNLLEPVVSSDASIGGTGSSDFPLFVDVAASLSITEEVTECGTDLLLTSLRAPATELARIALGKRALYTSPAAHGIPIGSVAPIRIDAVTGQVHAAQADTEANVADFHAYVVNATQVELLEDGFHIIPSHGLTDLLEWHVVSPTAAGQYTAGSALVGETIVQEALFPINDTCLFVDLQEARSPFRPCNTITSAAHGLVLPASGILPVRWNSATLKWVPAQADTETNSAKLYVAEIIDVNTFKIVPTGLLELLGHGLMVGSTYYLSPSSAGALVPESSLGPTDCKQRILTVISDDCVFLDPSGLICP